MSPIYRARPYALFGTYIGAAALGIAEAAVEHYLAGAKKRVGTMSGARGLCGQAQRRRRQPRPRGGRRRGDLRPRPLSRCVADMTVAARHTTQNWDVNASAYGRALLGLPIGVPALED